MWKVNGMKNVHNKEVKHYSGHVINGHCQITALIRMVMMRLTRC